MKSELPQIPLSPHDEGFSRGVFTDEYNLHFDGEDHRAYDMSEDVDETLANRPDFLTGLADGVDLKRKLEGLGYAVIRERESEVELDKSYGGSE